MSEKKSLKSLSEAEIIEWKRTRWQARTNLGFLCREILNYNLIDDVYHAPVLNILQKFQKPTREEFAFNDVPKDETKSYDFIGKDGKWCYKPVVDMNMLPGKRRRLILDPRSHAKTTINAIAHTIQWLINYPDIAIMVVQSTGDKAEAIIGEIKQHFTANPKFRAAFPEMVPKSIKEFGTKNAFTIPARGATIVRKEPSIMAGSIDKGSAGYHFDVMKFSDIVEPNNVGTEDQIQSVISSYFMMENLLVAPQYWIDVEGTRYAFCLDGDTNITTGDWHQKKISDVQVGDEVVGWAPEGKTRWLKKTKVTACGSYIAKTKKYTLESGDSVICTPEHQWWRGKQWKKGPTSKEYGHFGSGHKRTTIRALRRLMVPSKKVESYEDKLVSIEDAGLRPVYWFQTETGNYIANGYCSKNSDLYGKLLKHWEADIKRDGESPWDITVRGIYEKDTGGKPRKYTPEECKLPDKLDDKGHPIPVWPTRFHYKELKREEEQDPYIFSCQKRLYPVASADGAAPFPVSDKTPHWCSREVFKTRIPIVYREICVDTAETTNARSNYSSIAVVAWSRAGKCYVDEIIHGKFMPDDLVKKIIASYLKHNKPYCPVQAVKIEETGFVRGLMVSINQFMDKTNTYLPLQMIKRDTSLSKKQRIINTLQPWYGSGDLIFVDDIACKDHLLMELEQFPLAETDDILDSIADVFQNRTWFGRESERQVLTENHEERTAKAFQQMQNNYWKHMTEGTFSLDGES